MDRAPPCDVEVDATPARGSVPRRDLVAGLAFASFDGRRQRRELIGRERARGVECRQRIELQEIQRGLPIREFVVGGGLGGGPRAQRDQT